MPKLDRLLESALYVDDLRAIRGNDMVDLLDEFSIVRLVARFANCFDLKAWDELGECLCERLDTDYSDLRGTPPEILTRERFIDLRRLALQELKTHHLAGNVDVSVRGDTGSATVSMVIFRQNADGQVLNTHCVYALGVAKEHGTWRISSIVQKVLWSDGDKMIHRGIAR